MHDHLVPHSGVTIRKPFGLIFTTVCVLPAADVVLAALESAAADASSSSILNSTRFSRNAMSARLSPSVRAR